MATEKIAPFLKDKDPFTAVFLLVLAGLGVAFMVAIGWGWYALSAIDRSIQVWNNLDYVHSAADALEAEATVLQAGTQADAEIAGLDIGITELSRWVETRSLSVDLAKRSEAVRMHLASLDDAQKRSAAAVDAFEENLSGIISAASFALSKKRADMDDLSAQEARLIQQEAAQNAAKERLYDSVLRAQRAERQISAGLRMGALGNSDEMLRSSAARALADLPDCTPEPAQPQCGASPARLKAALQQVAHSEDVAAILRMAYTAATAYQRALANDREVLRLEAATTQRAITAQRIALVQIQNEVDRLSRFVTLSNTLRRSAIEVEAASLSDLDMVTTRARVTLTRFMAPARAIRPLLPDNGKGAASLIFLSDLLDRRWKSIGDALVARLEIEREIVAIKDRTEAAVEVARDQAVTAISTITSAGVAVTLALFTAVGFAAQILRRYVVMPVRSLTQAILSLARGERAELAYFGGALGLKALRDALISLREVFVERDALLSETSAQKEALEAAHDSIQYQALHDALTGLPNRRALETDMEALTSNEGDEKDFAFLHIDLDRFKEINDTLGHDAGDFILRHAARILDEQKPDSTTVHRIGGDEFLLFVQSGASSLDLVALGQSIVTELGCPVDFQGRVCRYGASIGVARGSDSANDPHAALMHADVALYEMKRAGRNGVRCFTDAMRVEIQRLRSTADDILRGLEEGEFVPFYQPQFRAGDRSLYGVEVLCRWQHPERGLLPPSEFLPVAEERNIIGEIDRSIFQIVANDVDLLQAAGHRIPKVGFNVTQDRLMQHSLIEELSAITGKGFGVAVELLELMSLDEPSENLRWALDSLQEAGVLIEIDDFGSHRASIAALTAVSPDAMKIDRTIVMPILEKPTQRELVRAIIGIGDTLGIDVVAEGVETEKHAEQLADMGCTALQGYALSHPLPLDALHTFLAEMGGSTATSNKAKAS